MLNAREALEISDKAIREAIDANLGNFEYDVVYAAEKSLRECVCGISFPLRYENDELYKELFAYDVVMALYELGYLCNLENNYRTIRISW